ncbi:hypothetical protein [Hymenobacter sp. UV11]|nr:hypothetical protein [Hymenobacter sp. UV11]
MLLGVYLNYKLAWLLVLLGFSTGFIALCGVLMLIYWRVAAD